MAGRGSRLRPHTLITPKPLVCVAGKPIVQHLVEEIVSVCNEKVEEIAFIIGDFGKEVEESLCNIALKLGAKPKIYYQKEQYQNVLPNFEKTSKIKFGQLYGTRSGDKGGCANLGVWAKNEDTYAYLYDFLTVDKLKELLPDLKKFKIERYELPNILSLNFYVHDILQDGVSSSTRLDGQAKSLGEYLRAKDIEAPDFLIN